MSEASRILSISRVPVSETPPKFCPFCRDPFEDEVVCPDHELTLVPFDKLPRGRGSGPPADDELLELYDPRFGRGWVALGAVLILIGFLLPLVTFVLDEPLVASGYEVAAQKARGLWAVPVVGAALISILVRRRTLESMRAARLAVPALALLGSVSLGYALVGLHRGAAQMGEALHRVVGVELGLGLWVTAAGLLLVLFGGLRLGAARDRDHTPHGGGPDGDAVDPIVFD